MFSRLIGNESAKALLSRLIKLRRVPNSMIFAGPEGVGKRQFALELARSYVCLSPGGGSEGCGECAACRRAAAFSVPEPSDKTKDEFRRVFLSEHPDVGLVTAYKRTILVDAIRSLESEAHFRPFEAAARVFIIDDADKMNDQAANALLKTLEEPPPTTHIILITPRPEGLLRTILSRSQVIRFASVPVSEIERFLLSTEKFEPEDASLAARVSQGSIGQALHLDINAFRAARQLMLDVLRGAVADDDLAVMLQTSEQIVDAKKGYGFDAMLDVLETLIRDIWSSTGGASRDSLVNSDLATDLAQLAARGNSLTLANWVSAIETTRQNLAVNINQRVAADALFVRMAALQP